MRVHLVDGTYELFRHYYALPKAQDASGAEVAAALGVVGSLIGLLEGGASHLGVATDHVIESFRNRLYPGYKDGSGIEPDLWSQFPLVERLLTAAGFQVWAMVEHEADDALGAAAAMAAADPAVEQVLICTPDKDLAQCVVGSRVVQFDRRRRLLIDHDAVVEKFGVEPDSMPDYLALVGDSADGYPGIPGWGAKSAATLLARYGYLEAIPADPAAWDVAVRGSERLAAALRDGWEDALLFRKLATIDRTAPVAPSVDGLRWRGPGPEAADFLEAAGGRSLVPRLDRLARERGGRHQ